jgi:HEAT repeat protein
MIPNSIRPKRSSKSLRERHAPGLAQSWDSALRNIFGFAFAKTTPVPARKPTRPGRGARPAVADDALGRVQAANRKLRAETVALERELERIHGMITSGMVPPAGAAAGGASDLDALVTKARELRDALQEKRLEVLRIEHNIGREQQLRRAERRPNAAPEDDKPAPATRRRFFSPKVAAGNDGRRRAVSRALGAARFADRSEELLVQRMADGLLHDDPEKRRDAVAKIAARPQPALSLLFLAAEDPNDRVRLAALSGLSGCRQPAASHLFRRFLRDRNAALRLAALRGLATIDARLLGDSELMATIEDPEPAVRRAAAALLGWRREGGKVRRGVLSALGFALYDDEEAVRLAAAEALGAAGDERAVFSLIRALRDESENVREAALRSLASIVHDLPRVDGLAGADRASALKAWWKEARVRERLSSGEEAAPVAARASAADLVAELKSQIAGVVARPAKAVVEPAPSELEQEGEEFESLLGDEEAAAEAAPEKAAAAPAAASSAEEPKEEGEQFENVLGEDAGDAEAADEEYESVLGD